MNEHRSFVEKTQRRLDVNRIAGGRLATVIDLTGSIPAIYANN